MKVTINIEKSGNFTELLYIFSDSYSVTIQYSFTFEFIRKKKKKDWPDRPTTWPEGPPTWPERPEKKIIQLKKNPVPAEIWPGRNVRTKKKLAGTSGIQYNLIRMNTFSFVNLLPNSLAFI